MVAAIVTDVVSQHGGVAEVRLDAGGATLLSHITQATVQTLGIARGRPLYAIVKAVAFDRSTLGPRLGSSPTGGDVVHA